jgi:hypothetical protein
MRKPTMRVVPPGALCHVEAALDVALQALRVHPHSSSNPGAAAGVPGTPPATQEARSGGGFGMSSVRGHKSCTSLRGSSSMTILDAAGAPSVWQSNTAAAWS